MGRSHLTNNFWWKFCKQPVLYRWQAFPIRLMRDNVVAYMRSAKTPTAADLASPDWNNKLFVKLISDALIAKISSGAVQLESVLTVLQQSLNEHHLLLKFDNPTLTAVLSNHHWDGAVRRIQGDFLMVVDTNVGFNKTNAVVAANMVYDVDLTKPAAPIGTLTVTHMNNATGLICKQWDKIRLPGEEDYPITDCYWNYLRVYMPGGTKLLDATPQFVPANWMLIKQDVPARVDSLDEGIPGVQAFGTLQVVPGGESVVTTFRFALPAGIIQSGIGQSIYQLLGSETTWHPGRTDHYSRASSQRCIGSNSSKRSDRSRPEYSVPNRSSDGSTV